MTHARLTSALLVLLLLIAFSACTENEAPPVTPQSTVAISGTPSPSPTPSRYEQVMRERFDTSFPVYGLAVEGRTIWAVGSHGFQRLRFAGNGPGLVSIREPVEVDKTLMSVDAGPTGVWAVGGGDGGDPYGELLRLGRERIARRISLPDSSPYDVLALGGTVWVADAVGDTLDIVYPDDASAPDGHRIVQSGSVLEPISVIRAAGHIFALSSGGGADSWARIDPGTGAAELTVDTGRCSIDLAVGARSVWVADYCKDIVQRFSLGGELLAEIEVGNRPSAIAFEYRTVWVGNGGAVSSILPRTNKVTARWPVSGRVHEVLIERGSLLVAHKTFVTRILMEL